MNRHYENYLRKKYPILYDKSSFFGGFAIDDGWFNIVNQISQELCHTYTQAKTRYDYAIEKGLPVTDVEICKYELMVAERDHPKAVQVKEKFGGLRFYANNCTEDQYLVIAALEDMSLKTCEVCGDRGKQRTGGWITTLCGKHSLELNRRKYESGS